MVNDSINEMIAKDMLRYIPCPQMRNVKRANNLNSWGLEREVGDFLLNNPNAFLFGAIFDYLIKYKDAWKAPFELYKRLGFIDPFKIAKLKEDQLSKFIQRGSHGKSLHRFPNVLSKRLILASKKLISEYNGDASNIWPDGTSAKIALERLEEFEGISQKISRMIGRALGTYFGVSLINWNEIDIAVDRHVARVFLRTGLVHRQPGEYSVSGVRYEIINCARELRPSFPGCLDEPTFSIGLDWCRSGFAYCDNNKSGESCPLRKSCRRVNKISIKGQ